MTTVRAALVQLRTPASQAAALAQAEPLVRQPVAIDFDERGRLWVIQYLQYPNPSGLKRVQVDRYSRTVYDRVPEPPPKGPKGADRITILSDFDKDGRALKSKDFVTGLNLCTGMCIGHGGVYVLQVPYLLFYPDKDGDDVPDGGSAIFAATIRRVRARIAGCAVEVLIPDFQSNWEALATVMAAQPDVLNHNIETVRRLHATVRPRCGYDNSLELLRRARELGARVTKSGLMVGLGETHDELVEAFGALREAGVQVLTVGQYLRPSERHLPIVRYWHPDEFAALERAAYALGFEHVAAGPLVRSSYHAHEQSASMQVSP